VKRCLGFWMKDGVYIAGEWYPAKGKAVWETDEKKVFPCVPVSELKKVIESLNPVDVAGCLTSNRAIVYKMGYRDCKTELKNKLKELGLSEEKKAVGLKRFNEDNSVELTKEKGD